MYNLIVRIFQVREDVLGQKNVKIMRKMTKVRLKNIGLYYLKRFESSTANLRNVLQRRVNNYVYQKQDIDKKQAWIWIEEIITEFQKLGYLDDHRYAEIKVKSYLEVGKSARYIHGKLREKGISEQIINAIIAEQEFDPFEAAMKLARKKRIGPYCQDQNLRKERKSKDLAVLVRAGFDYDVAISVLETQPD